MGALKQDLKFNVYSTISRAYEKLANQKRSFPRFV